MTGLSLPSVTRLDCSHRRDRVHARDRDGRQLALQFGAQPFVLGRQLEI